MDVIAAGGILSAKQDRRRARDWYYMSAHSQQNKRFVQVDEADAAAVRKMVASRGLHRSREAQCGFKSHYARMATIGSAQKGFIDSKQVQRDMKVHREAKFAKHDTEADFAKASPRSGKYHCLNSSGVRRHPWSDMRNPLVSGHANPWHGIWEEFPSLSTGPLPRQTKDEVAFAAR